MVEGLLGPALPDHEARMSMSAHAALVGATPMLDWMMTRCFFSRCNVGPNPADVSAAEARSTLTAYLNAAAWRRILEELCTGGLIDLLQGATSIQHFRKAMDEVVPANPANLQLMAADWVAAEPFTTVAAPGIARVPGARGVAPIPAVPAVAADAGPSVLLFLNMADLTLLECKGHHHPMEVWARVAGMLGPCATRASRARALATSNVIARMLASAMTHKFGDLDEAGKAVRQLVRLHSRRLSPLRARGAHRHLGRTTGGGARRLHLPPVGARLTRCGSHAANASSRGQVISRNSKLSYLNIGFRSTLNLLSHIDSIV
ncbi:MAG: hypothetical protein SGPRY_008685 [Prymnesium sp.]